MIQNEITIPLILCSFSLLSYALVIIVPNGCVLQECESAGANQMIEHLREMISNSKPGENYGVYPRKLHEIHRAHVSVLTLSNPYCFRQLYTSICGWLHLHWPSKPLHMFPLAKFMTLYLISIVSYLLQFHQVDGSIASKQGLRFVFKDGSRIIFRLSVCLLHIVMFYGCSFWVKCLVDISQHNNS